METTRGENRRGASRRAATWMLLLFVFVAPWENVVVLPAVGTLARVLGLMLFGLSALSFAVTGSLRRPTEFHYLAALFSLWSIATVAWSVDFGISIFFAATLLQLMVLAYLLYDLLDNPHSHGQARFAGVLGGYIVSAILIFNGLTGNVSEFDRRATIPNSNENDIGVVLAILMPIAWHYANDRTNPKLNRLVSVAYIPIAFGGIIFTASRTSLLVGLVFVVMVMASLTRAGKVQKFFYPVVIAATTVFVAVSAPESSFERLGTIGSSVQQGDFGSRQFFWRAALELINEGTLTTVFGFGLGTFDSLVGNSAHQTFLALIVEVGIVGLVLFLASVAVVAWHVRTLEKVNRQMWTTALLIWFISVQTLSWHFFTFTWLLFALIIADGRWKGKSWEPASSESTIDLQSPAHHR